jgi:hypothetical protein
MPDIENSSLRDCCDISSTSPDEFVYGNPSISLPDISSRAKQIGPWFTNLTASISIRPSGLWSAISLISDARPGKTSRSSSLILTNLSALSPEEIEASLFGGSSIENSPASSVVTSFTPTTTGTAAIGVSSTRTIPSKRTSGAGVGVTVGVDVKVNVGVLVGVYVTVKV